MKDFLSSLFSTAGLFLLVILAARLTFIQQIGLELSPDEAYYWDWSRHLDWGYFSKPPMVAWIIHIFTKNLGINEYAVRVPAALLSTLYLALIYYLGQKLFDRKVGLWAALAAVSSPLASIYSFVMTIDPPLLFFWALSLYLGWKAAQSRRLLDFFFLGLSVGCGLLTKQTMLAFLAMYILWLFLEPSLRPLLRKKQLYIFLCTILIVIFPNLIWNIRHGWITFKHTQEHFKEQGIFILGPLKFLLEQAGVITPVTFFLMIFIFFIFLSREKLRLNKQLNYLFIMSAIPLFLVVPLSVLRKINANWPYPFYSSGYILLSALILYGNWPNKLGLFLKRLFFLGVCLGMIIALLIYQIPRTPNIFPVAIQKLLYKFSGWKDLSTNVQKYRKSQELIITSRRDYAAELAFYLPDHPQTYTYWQGRIRSQYDLWDGLPEKIGQNALLILKKQKEAQKLKNCFDELQFLELWEKEIFRKKRKVFIYKGRHLRQCSHLGSPEGKY